MSRGRFEGKERWSRGDIQADHQMRARKKKGKKRPRNTDLLQRSHTLQMVNKKNKRRKRNGDENGMRMG